MKPNEKNALARFVEAFNGLLGIKSKLQQQVRYYESLQSKAVKSEVALRRIVASTMSKISEDVITWKTLLLYFKILRVKSCTMVITLEFEDGKELTTKQTIDLSE